MAAGGQLAKNTTPGRRWVGSRKRFSTTAAPRRMWITQKSLFSPENYYKGPFWDAGEKRVFRYSTRSATDCRPLAGRRVSGFSQRIASEEQWENLIEECVNKTLSNSTICFEARISACGSTAGLALTH